MQRGDLIAFTEEIAAEFNAAKIPHPVHLSDGNEDQLLDIFTIIDTERDWVCGTWRQHYQCLLKGVPPEELKAAIRSGQSIALNFPEYRIVSSAIVGGILPIATGIALAIKRRGGNERVHCFLGDMAAHSGAFHESLTYARAHNLPVRFIIENNEHSVCTPTEAVWPGVELPSGPLVEFYQYRSKWPHAGAGKRVEF